MKTQPDDPGPGDYSPGHNRYVPYDHLHDDDVYTMVGLVIIGALVFLMGFGLASLIWWLL